MNNLYFKPHLFLLLASTVYWLLLPSNGMAQNLIDIEQRIAWEMAQDDKPTNNTLVFTPQFSVETTRGKVDSNLLNLFTGGSYNRVLRLLDGENVLLIGIPSYDPIVNMNNPLFAARYLINDAKNSFSKLDNFTVDDAGIFGEVVYKDRLMQKPIKPFFRNIDVKIFGDDPEELHIKLSDGDYGDATLIYTPLSAQPKIILQ